MKAKTVMLGLIAGALVVSPLGISAQPDEARIGKHHDKMAAELKLNDEQKAKLKELHKANREAMKPFFEKMKGVRDKIKAELLKPESSKQALDGFAAQLGDLHKQMALKRNQHLLQVKKVLTPEQFKKLVSRDWKHRTGIKGKRPHKGERRDMRGHGPGPGPGEGPDEM
jgi:Spy/CpxP family protein refolding chaperone